ncbi:hypothetical protein QFZ56_000416 [Streptomyces achromogenes]|uniref:Uncharacterized protein n=1 Tax=Streptomyces achromogenes TaxID=67255 RepID=A0ABU0PSU6_STRAH|nr:hypothetical protein [Streptomyces achromogenes]
MISPMARWASSKASGIIVSAIMAKWPPRPRPSLWLARRGARHRKRSGGERTEAQPSEAEQGGSGLPTFDVPSPMPKIQP